MLTFDYEQHSPGFPKRMQKGEPNMRLLYIWFV